MKKIYIFILFFIYFNSFSQEADTNLSALISFDGEPNIAINPTNPNNIIVG